jgi:hypothetical protein
MHDETDLFVRLAQGTLDALARAEMTGDGDVDLAGVGFLREAATLEEDRRRGRAREDDPEVDAPVPVPIAVHEAASLRATERATVGRAEIEQLGGVVRGHGGGVGAAGLVRAALIAWR